MVIEHYKPKTRVIRMRKEGVILLRVGGYVLALTNVTHKNETLIDYLKSFRSPKGLLDGLMSDVFFGGLFYEKALRMYIGWVTHPQLYIDVFDGRVKVSNIPMVVNGHVCKVLARTGFMSSVLIEDKSRPIVIAEKERDNIEKLIRHYYPDGDYFMIDYGAFYIGFNICYEENPSCEKCPITNCCKKNTRVRAY